MNKSLERRLAALEQQNGDHGIRVITLDPDDPIPPEGLGLTIVDDISRLVLAAEDFGEDAE